MTNERWLKWATVRRLLRDCGAQCSEDDAQSGSKQAEDGSPASKFTAAINPKDSRQCMM
jgi:hypothetical protein